MKLSFGKSLEETLGFVSVSFSAFVCFIVIDLTGQGTGLTNAKIFSTMELLVTLKFQVYFMGIFISTYYELLIIFGRFCTILNIQDKRMIRID